MYYMPSANKTFFDHSEIRASLPQNVILPSMISEEELEFLGIYPLAVDECPKDYTKVFSKDHPVMIDGVWRQGWAEKNANKKELAEMQAAMFANLTEAVARRIDAFAATRGYGDEKTSPIIAACSYAASEHERYGAEGRYCMKARENTWDAFYKIQSAVLASEREMPQSLEDIEAELPVLAWPKNITGKVK